jgi:hypothetical protein
MFQDKARGGNAEKMNTGTRVHAAYKQYASSTFFKFVQ